VTTIICGVDVSSKALDVCVRLGGGQLGRFENSPAGVEDLVGFCRRHRVGLVVLEATGGYERLAFGLLWAEGLPVAVANPRAVRRFAEAMGLLEKTDRIDAAAIAWYAEAKRLAARPPAAPAQRRLAALVTRLRQLTALRTAQANQRRLVADPDARRSIDEILARVGRQSRELEATIVELIGDDPVWGALDRTFRSIKGVAGRTVAHLLAELPEIGTLSNKAVAKLAGLAPFARDSGQRAVRAGRGGIRAILYVVADVVRRHHPDLRRLPPQAPRPSQRQSPRCPPPTSSTRLTNQTVAPPSLPRSSTCPCAPCSGSVPTRSAQTVP
jgi:transposase